MVTWHLGIVEGGETAWAAVTWRVGVVGSSGRLSSAVTWRLGLVGGGDSGYVRVRAGFGC